MITVKSTTIKKPRKLYELILNSFIITIIIIIIIIIVVVIVVVVVLKIRICSLKLIK